MIVYRLSKSQYAEDLSGKGAEKVGGRWNSKGVSILYTSSSIALCVAEVAVHLPLGLLPKDYVIIKIEIPDSEIIALDESRLPSEWYEFPHPDETQKIGDAFVNLNKALCLKVPSAAVFGEFNYLVNPNHKLSHTIKIRMVESFTFNKRLFIKTNL